MQPDSADGLKTKRKKLSFSVWQRDIVISAVLCVVILIAGFYWAKQIQLPREHELQLHSITEFAADQQRSNVNRSITQLQDRLQALSRSPQLHIALSTNNQQQIQAIESSLALQFPEASSGQIIAIAPMGIADKNSETQRLHNHIEIGMLAAVIKDKSIHAEAYRHKDQWILSMALLVDPQAAIFIRFPVKMFQTVLHNQSANHFYSELAQRYKDRRDVVIHSTGQPLKEFQKTRKLNVPGWELNIAPQQDMADIVKIDGTIIWLLAVLSLSLIAASHAIFYSRSTAQSRVPKHTVAPKYDVDVHDILDNNSPAQPLPVSPPLITSDTSSETLTDTDADENTDGDSHLASNCFRAYDIRGVADRDLSDKLCSDIGRAFGSEMQQRHERKILLGRDARLSSPRIHAALVQGLLNTGTDVVDLGIIATPMLHFASQSLDIGNSIMITGSHNNADYNGMKISLQGQTISADDIQRLRQRIERQDFNSGNGEQSSESIEEAYIERITNDVVIAQTLKVVIDAGNGATSNIAPRLFQELGCEVIPLFCKLDGNFPNHAPDPTASDNLKALRETVASHHADIGIAFDGDGDRVAIVSSQGQCPHADQLLMILVDDMVGRNPGAEILFDVKCSRLLPRQIVDNGGRATMWKCGHANMKRKMAESGALLGGEFSGHIFFKERWYGFDDGMYTAARLIETLSLSGTTVDEALAALPSMCSTPEIIIPVADEEKFSVIEKFRQQQEFSDAIITDIDGLRIDFHDGWGLIRASNTGPAITLRFEADSEEHLASIRQGFKVILGCIDPEIAAQL